MKLTTRSLALMAALVISAWTLADDHAIPSVKPDEALSRLKEGNERFAKNNVTAEKPIASRRTETAKAQNPFAIVVGCADSRTAPEIIFDQNIGDLFVVRVAGNLVDDYALGSIEYAVEHLGARLIVVLGHERCGAVTAALASDSAPGHVQSVVRDIQPAVQAVKGKPGDATQPAVAENAHLMAEKIRKEANLGDLAKDVQIIFALY